MRYLEGLLGDSADKHERELQALRDAHAKFAAAHGKHAKDIESLRALQGHHATVEERLQFIEKAIGDSAEKHGAAIEKLRAAHAKHAAALEKHAKDSCAALAAHATVNDRIYYLEQLLGDSADKHAQDVAALKAAAEKHARELAGTKDLHARVASDTKQVQATSMNVSQRLDLLEQRLRHAFEA
mmetsp:Transcript_33690/g.98048  ORF Transcript_33690/g.98048 Transcript_33690/m.98048 type:complete len:184 (+) Transcript_33690:3-554(+)